ncbi:MAG: ABC transporter ATP-binding protein [Candidatus Acidiferrales bacterium]
MSERVAGRPVISFRNIHIGFGEGEVLKGVSFDVSAGETKVLLGEGGAGKTLLMKLAAGLLRPDSGEILVMDRNLAQMTESDLLEFRRHIGFVFQEGALFDSMTVAQNVSFRMSEEKIAEEEIESRVREALRFVELEDAFEKLPEELSGGMRRRVAIARAVADRPKILFYDSPTAGLDPVTSQTIIALILRLRDTIGATSLLATHRLQDAFGLANYSFDAAANRVVPVAKNGGRPAHPTNVVVLRDGRNYFEGDTKQVLDSSDPYLKGFLASVA